MESKVVPSDEAKRLNVLGVDTRVRLGGADTGGTLALLELFMPPGAEVPRHTHAHEDETFRVQAGVLEVTVGGRVIAAEAGTTVYTPRGLPHAVRAGPEGARVLVVTCPAGIEHMFAALDQLPPGPPDLHKLAEICAHYGVSFG